MAEAGDRLTALDAPAVAAFKALAKELDTHFLAATAAQFGLQHRHLLKRLASDEATPDDDDDDLLTPR